MGGREVYYNLDAHIFGPLKCFSEAVLPGVGEHDFLEITHFSPFTRLGTRFTPLPGEPGEDIYGQINWPYHPALTRSAISSSR